MKLVIYQMGIRNISFIIIQDKMSTERRKLLMEHIFKLQEFCNSMVKLCIDGYEYAYLKAIVLFSPGRKHLLLTSDTLCGHGEIEGSYRLMEWREIQLPWKTMFFRMLELDVPYDFRRNEYGCLYKNVHMNVHNIIHNR